MAKVARRLRITRLLLAVDETVRQIEVSHRPQRYHAAALGESVAKNHTNQLIADGYHQSSRLPVTMALVLVKLCPAVVRR